MAIYKKEMLFSYSDFYSEVSEKKDATEKATALDYFYAVYCKSFKNVCNDVQGDLTTANVFQK